MTVCEIYTKGKKATTTYVKFRDDEKQGKNDKGDKDIKKNKKISRRTEGSHRGTYRFGAGGTYIAAAVSESPDKNKNGIGDGFE